MGWAETRAKARATVHSTFSLPAVYTSPDGTVNIPCRARMHNEKKMFGDLDREQYAMQIEDVNVVIFDAIDIEPARHGTVDFGAGKKFVIVNFYPRTTDTYIRAEVTLTT